MADDNEDTLLASMKEAIAEEKGEKPEKEQEVAEEVSEEPEKEVKDELEPEKDSGANEEDEEDKPTRGQNRHQKLSNELKEERAERAREREERDKLIAERATYAAKLEQYERQQSEGQSAAQRRAEEQRLELLTPEERKIYEADIRSKSLEQRLNRMELERQDDRDRSEFRSRSNQDPLVEKYADRVEQMRQDDIKRLGVAAPRDAYLNFIVGEAIRKDATSKLSAKKEAAGKRINSVTSKSATARGDVSGTKTGKGDSLEELTARLANVIF